MDHSPHIFTPPRFLRQAQSYHAQVQGSLSSPRSPSKDDLRRHSKYTAASLGRPNKISHNLFPLISRFEALDALSHEIQLPELPPPPLQNSRNSMMGRGGLDGPTSMKLEAIFSPRRRSRRSCEEVLLVNMSASPPDDVFASGTVKRSGSGRLKQTQSANKVNNIRLRSGMHQNNLSTLKECNFRIRVPSYTGQKTETAKESRGNSIRDRIKIFDGCVERTTPSGHVPSLQATNSAHGSLVSVSTAPNSEARISLLQNIALATPTCHKPTSHHRNVAKLPSTVSRTGRSSRKTVPTKSYTPQTPTRSNASHNTRIQRPFEQHVPNPFFQTPHVNPPTRQISPMTASTGQKIDKQNPIRRPLYGTSKILPSIKKDASPEDKSCRFRGQEPPAKCVNSMSKERKTSEKLEAVPRGRGLERAVDPTIDRRDSKLKDMKMLRERSVVAKSFESGPWSLSKASGTKIPRPTWRDFSHAAPSALIVCASPPLATAPKSIRACSKNRQMDGIRIRSLVRREQACPSTPTKAVCRGIHDKIKRWERKTELRGKFEEEPQVICSSKAVGNSIMSRKSTYENPWNEEVERELEKRGLKGQEVQAVMDEFQEIGGGPNNNDETGGTWKMVVAPRLGKSGLTAQRDGETDESSADMAMRIIVREAQCGLAEPKPLRLLEMKRMILLCRERVGPGCKDGSSRSYPMKV